LNLIELPYIQIFKKKIKKMSTKIKQKDIDSKIVEKKKAKKEVMMKKLINLTPHEVVLYASDGCTVIDKIPSSGNARVAMSEELIGELNGIPVVRSVSGGVEGMPDPQAGVVYIVSFITLQALVGTSDRCDFVSPNTNSACVRDDEGNILGVMGFQGV